MKGSTLIGLIIGFIAIFGAFIWEGGTLDALIMLPAMTIVFGGTLAAGLAGSSLNMMSRLPKLFKIAFFPKRYNIEAIIAQIVQFASVARRDGILAIEPMLKKTEHPFLKKLFEICIDGADPETLRQIVDNEIRFITERHNANIDLFVKMGGYSPTMGIIGTVMGLISTLAAAGSDPNVLIHHIASAFIATMWGILMANIVWLPVGDKLRTLHNEEMKILEVMLEGVMAVQLGETPNVIRQRLASALPLSEQDRVMKGVKGSYVGVRSRIQQQQQMMQPQPGFGVPPGFNPDEQQPSQPNPQPQPEKGPGDQEKS
ncbi:MAG: motility protein A [Candidatus Kapaibacterium sp.]